MLFPFFRKHAFDDQIARSPTSTRFFLTFIGYTYEWIYSAPFQGKGIPTKEIPFQFRPSLRQGEKFVRNLSRGTNVTHERWKMGERRSPGALLGSIKIYLASTSTDLAAVEIGPRDSGDLPRCNYSTQQRKEKKRGKQASRNFAPFSRVDRISLSVSTFVSLNFAGTKRGGA